MISGDFLPQMRACAVRSPSGPDDVITALADAVEAADTALKLVQANGAGADQFFFDQAREEFESHVNEAIRQAAMMQPADSD